MTTPGVAGLDLAGLAVGCAQTWGAIRIVPLLRERPLEGLRLHARLAETSERSERSETSEVSYIPHAFVADWTGDTDPVAAYGAQLRDPSDDSAPVSVELFQPRRMTRRQVIQARRAHRHASDQAHGKPGRVTGGQRRQRLRFLPLHLAMEGYLTLHFGGPTIAWQEWTRYAVIRGLSLPAESSYRGSAVAGLEDALRVFEIHPNQCGMVLYVADAPAAAFVVPHPDDYRALHPTLLLDFYGELLCRYSRTHSQVPDYPVRLDDIAITSLADVRAQVSEIRAGWAAFHATMAGGLLTAERLAVLPVQRVGRFSLSRFLPVFDPDVDNHIGESIVDDSGRLAYLKTFRLSAAQTRRGHLLTDLAAHSWNLDAAAAALGADRREFALRLHRAGLDHLLRPAVIACFGRPGKSGKTCPGRGGGGGRKTGRGRG